MLSENDLAASLQMSRTPIRAALVRLQAEGWVTIYPQRGVQVRQLTDVEIREAAEVRRTLETAGVQLSSQRGRKQIKEDLHSNLDAQARALDDGDFPGFATLATAFHRAFVMMADNALMLSLYDRVLDRQYLSMLSSAQRITSGAEQVLAEHRDLLRLATSGDWAEFGNRLQQHQMHHAIRE